MQHGGKLDFKALGLFLVVPPKRGMDGWIQSKALKDTKRRWIDDLQYLYGLRTHKTKKNRKSKTKAKVYMKARIIQTNKIMVFVKLFVERIQEIFTWVQGEWKGIVTTIEVLLY